MTETTRNYRGIATLALLGAVAIGALIYLKMQPQPQPAPPPPAVTAQAPASTPGPVFDVVRVDPQGNVVLKIDAKTCNLNLVTHAVSGCN